MKEQANVAELRTKAANFFRSRKLAVPANWTDEQLLLFDKHILTSYRQRVQHGTRGNSRIRAIGPSNTASQPASESQSVSDTEDREQRLRKGLAALA